MSMSENQNSTREYRVIGGGFLALVVDGAVSHWNDDVPGDWVGLYILNQVGSYISKYCAPEAGVYRLIGLNDEGKPETLKRMCGDDQTGTLYIGCEGKTLRSAVAYRSLCEPCGSLVALMSTIMNTKLDTASDNILSFRPDSR